MFEKEKQLHEQCSLFIRCEVWTYSEVKYMWWPLGATVRVYGLTSALSHLILLKFISCVYVIYNRNNHFQ